MPVAEKELRELLEIGSSRKVYSLGNGMVEKVAYTHFGRYQNWIEWIVYQKAKESGLNGFLGTIHAYRNGSIIMEELIPLEYSYHQAALYLLEGAERAKVFAEMYGLSFEKLNELLQLCRLHDADFLLPTQWGRDSEGNLKCFDYGMTSRMMEYYLDSKHYVIVD